MKHTISTIFIVRSENDDNTSHNVAAYRSEQAASDAVDALWAEWERLEEFDLEVRKERREACRLQLSAEQLADFEAAPQTEVNWGDMECILHVVDGHAFLVETVHEFPPAYEPPAGAKRWPSHEHNNVFVQVVARTLPTKLGSHDPAAAMRDYVGAPSSYVIDELELHD